MNFSIWTFTQSTSGRRLRHCILLQMVCKDTLEEPNIRRSEDNASRINLKYHHQHILVDNRKYLVAKFSTLPPVPKTCKYIVQYSCSKDCTILSGSWQRGNLTSTGACNFLSCKCSDGERVSRNKAAYFKSRNNRHCLNDQPGLLGFLKWVFTNVICCKNNVCCHNLFSRFVDLSSMPTLTNLDMEYVCGTTLGTQYITVPFHIFRKALGYV